MQVFAAATRGWFITRSRWYESVAMLLVTFTLLRPDFFLDLAFPKYQITPAQQLMELASATPQGSGMRARIEGTTIEGKELKKTVLIPLAREGSGPQRISKSGLTIMSVPAGVRIAAVVLHSPAE
jgi:hypothetical protein